MCVLFSWPDEFCKRKVHTKRIHAYFAASLLGAGDREGTSRNETRRVELKIANQITTRIFQDKAKRDRAIGSEIGKP